MAKNTFERYPDGGIEGALRQFDEAQEWAEQDPFSSFADYITARRSPIIEKDVLTEHFPDRQTFIKEVRSFLGERTKREERLGYLAGE